MTDTMRDRKQLPEGTIILKEKPFVYCLSSKFRTDYCDFCFKKGELLKCSNCRYVHYCNKTCQKEGWSIHKLECRNLKRVSPKIVPDAARFLTRLIKVLQKGGDLTKSYYQENCFRMFKDLMSHYPNLKGDERRIEHFTSLCGVLNEIFGEEPLPNSAELMGMYGRMCINSFNILDQELQCLGTGIYLGASVIDHSCKPNAIAFFEGTTIYIRTLQTFQYFDWSQVFISYIDILNPTQVRREELQATYYFHCLCSRCLETEPPEMLAAACPNQDCDNYIDDLTSRKCWKCQSEITEEFIEKFNEVTELTDIHLRNMEQLAYLDVCEICLQKQQNVLHRFNIKHVKILDLAFQSCIDFQKWDTAKVYAVELIDAYHKYYGERHPLTGLLHLKLGKILLFEEQSREALRYFTVACEILKVTHGTASTLFEKELLPLLQQARLETGIDCF